MMNIRLLAFGSRGDVQPFIALGLGLQRAGYQVSIGADARFTTFIEHFGLTAVPAQVDALSILQADQMSLNAKWEQLRKIWDETARLSEGVDALIYAPAALFAAPHVAEKRGIPAIPALLQPYLNPTGQFPAVGLPMLPLGSSYNRLSYGMLETFVWMFLRGRINHWRAETLDLPPIDTGPFETIRRQNMPILYAFSPHVLAKPADWGSNVHITGYWFLPTAEGWKPPAGLTAFLKAGPPPVYVGFGSMATRDARHTAQIVMEALDRLGARAVLVSGVDGLAAPHSSENEVLQMDNVPHDWLFPQMAAVVHHGGAGTLGAALRAGRPNVIVPFTGDQPFWGAQVERLGVGPAPVPHRHLSATALTHALHTALHDEAMQARAAAIGEQLRAEDGVSEALTVIEHVLGKAEPALA